MRPNARLVVGLVVVTVLSVGAFLVAPSLGPGVLPVLLLAAVPLSMLLVRPTIPDELRDLADASRAGRGPTPEADQPLETEPTADEPSSRH